MKLPRILRDLARKLRPVRPGELEVTVRVLSGPHAGEEFSLKLSERRTIGRSRARDISLPQDRRVSRYHAELTAFDGCCYVEDVGSNNGTYIGDTRIDHRMELRSGQVIRVGESRLQITW